MAEHVGDGDQVGAAADEGGGEGYLYLILKMGADEYGGKRQWAVRDRGTIQRKNND